MPAPIVPIKSPDELARLINDQGNLIGLALVEGVGLELDKKGQVTAQKEGKLKQYTVEEASILAIATVHNLITKARGKTASAFNPNDAKHKNFILDNYGFYLEAIRNGLVKEGDSKAQALAVAVALDALSELSSGIAILQNQADVEASAEFPAIYLADTDNTLYDRDAYELTRMHGQALLRAQHRFCGDQIDLKLPQWKTMPESELSATYREGEFNAYLEELAQFLSKQDRLRQGISPTVPQAATPGLEESETDF